MARQALIESLVVQESARGPRPTAFADWAGATYVAGRSDDHRKTHGLYLTPPKVAAFMASLIAPRPATMRLLDPAAGAGILLCAAVEYLVEHPNRPRGIDLTACEIDPDLCAVLRTVLDRAVTWASEHGVSVNFEVRQQDFVLTNASVLAGTGGERFDVVITNPPYFKLGKDDPRAAAAAPLVHGQPNIYGLMMAISAAMLQAGGDFVSITPRSFASGPYFQRFRQRFFGEMRPVQAHVFGSRRDAFRRDDVLQENVILHAVRDDGWMSRPGTNRLTMSSSAGIADLVDHGEWSVPMTDVLPEWKPGSVFRIPSSPADDSTFRLVDEGTGSLRRYGLEISTGPVVPFRATEWLSERPSDATVPLLWMNHVRAMAIDWPNRARKPQHIVSAPGSRRLLLPNRTYVLLRRFSAKEERRRLTAAPLLAGSLAAPLVGVENHLNYIHRPGTTLTEDEAWGLAGLFNSELFDTYFRSINGNTQVGATELRAMPLPPLERIVELGARLRHQRDPLAVVDDLVMAIATDRDAIADDASEAVA